MIDLILRLSAGFAVTGHVDGARRSHVYVSEVNPEGLAAIEGSISLFIVLWFEMLLWLIECVVIY